MLFDIVLVNNKHLMTMLNFIIDAIKYLASSKMLAF